MTSDPFNLARFESAQSPIYSQVLAELRASRKQTHWMWFVFPQLAGLGTSATARRYAVGSLAEAQAYLAHNLLGPRLTECTQLTLTGNARSALDLFGTPDDLKFRSCMTLFHAAGEGPFGEALAAFFDGIGDPVTERLLLK